MSHIKYTNTSDTMKLLA